MVVTVFMLFWTVLEQTSKVRLISEISEFSFLALGQIRNSEISERFFSVSRLICVLYRTVICNGVNYFHAFFDCVTAKE